MSIEQAARWERSLRALCATLPPADGKSADEYTTELQHIDTDRRTAAPAVLLVPETAAAEHVHHIAEIIGDEVSRRRWLTALNETLLRTAEGALTEARLREAEVDESDLGWGRSFAEGAEFVLAALHEVMRTDNSPQGQAARTRFRAATQGPGPDPVASGVDAPLGPGMSAPGPARAMKPETETTSD